MSKSDVFVPVSVTTDVHVDVAVFGGERTNYLHVHAASKPVSPTRYEMAQHQGQASTKTLITCFIGIFVCYFYYGILQENVTRSDYGIGETKERFNYFFCLVLVQCIINAMFAKSVLLFSNPGPDSTSNKLYALCAISYIGAMVASNSALKFVRYPFQVLGKSCKPIPVMVFGVLLASKRYPLRKYLCVLLIVIGVATFVYKENKGSSENVIGLGELLLVTSLTLDGLTGVAQEKMRSEHHTSPHHMMANVNQWSILYVTIIAVMTGEIFQFLNFVSRYPYVIWKILMFGAASALGQHFIFVTVTTFGPLTCSIMTTTRKFFTILASVVIFANPILARQWVGVLLVFTGLGLDSVFGKSKPIPLK